MSKHFNNDSAVRRQLESLTNYSLIAYLVATLVLCATIMISFFTLKNILDEQSLLNRFESTVFNLYSSLQKSSVTLSDLKLARSQPETNSRLPHKIALVLQSEIDTAQNLLSTLSRDIANLQEFDSFDNFSNLFNRPPHDVKFKVEQYLARLQDLASPEESIGDSFESMWLPVEATIARNGSLAKSYSKASSELSFIINQRSEHLTKMHKQLSIISIALVILELAFLFYPLTRRFRRVSTNLSEAHDALHAQANYDQATGWLNTAGMGAKLRNKHYIGAPDPECAVDGLVLIHIDNLDKVSEIVGVSNLDKFFQQFSQRIANEFKTQSTLFRSGESEFAIVLTDTEIPQTISRTAKIQRNITTRLFVGESLVFPEIRIGITQGEYSVDALSLALLHARLSARAYDGNTSEMTVYSSELSNKIEQENSLISDMRKALFNNEFVPYYQIKVDAQSTLPLGMEALCRWVKGDGTVIPPGVFIELSEKSGLITDITWQILQKIALDYAHWRALGLEPGRIAFNAAELVLRDPDFEQKLDSLLKTINEAVCPLDMEITENVATYQDMDRISSSMNYAKDQGLVLALDDFGTGFASLSSIVELDFDTIKVDQSFVQKIDVNEKSENIVIAIIQLCKQLNKKCIVEGVETKNQWEFCRDLGCDEIQGYYFYKPAPANEIEKALSAVDIRNKAA